MFVPNHSTRMPGILVAFSCVPQLERPHVPSASVCPAEIIGKQDAAASAQAATAQALANLQTLQQQQLQAQQQLEQANRDKVDAIKVGIGAAGSVDCCMLLPACSGLCSLPIGINAALHALSANVLNGVIMMCAGCPAARLSISIPSAGAISAGPSAKRGL